MATNYGRVRIGWGLVDLELVSAETPQYGPTQYVYAGPSAAAGVGVGVRRATLVVNRAAANPADDAMNVHFDFMNITDGDPDDSWTPADYATLEARILAWFGTFKIYFPSYSALERIAWHRVGPGVVKPNPAERILDIAAPIAGTGLAVMLPQQACTVTLRTGIRRSWGRTYFPMAVALTGSGRISTGVADDVVAQVKALRDNAATDDFLMVVTSLARSSALGIEAIECDTTLDIVRRRRWKHTAYKKVTAIT